MDPDPNSASKIKTLKAESQLYLLVRIRKLLWTLIYRLGMPPRQRPQHPAVFPGTVPSSAMGSRENARKETAENSRA